MQGYSKLAVSVSVSIKKNQLFCLQVAKGNHEVNLPMYIVFFLFFIFIFTPFVKQIYINRDNRKNV